MTTSRFPSAAWPRAAVIGCIAAVVCGLLGAACANSSAESRSPTAVAPSAGSEEPVPPQPAASDPIDPADLAGSWVEYWAVQGNADTERYVFTAPDAFEWQGSPDSAGHQPLRRSGTFHIEPHGSARFLVLRVEREAFAGCSGPCAEPNASPREVRHRTGLTERHELGECPQNPEAERLDASYTCLAIGGKAFWRKSAEGPAPQQAAATEAPAR